MNDMNEFDLTVSNLRSKGLNSDQILEELSILFRKGKSEGKANPWNEKEPMLLTNKHKENKLSDILLKIGIPRHLVGYSYIIKAVLLYESNTKLRIVKDIYNSIAEEFNSSIPCIERGIRVAIECAFQRGDPDVLDEMFGKTVSYSKDRPTNLEFIARCAELLKQ